MRKGTIPAIGCALALLAAAAPVWAAQGGCVDVALSLSPDPVCRGEMITADASITNCGDRRDVVDLTFTISTPFGDAFIGQTTIVLREGETRGDSITATVPMDVPLGIYSVTVDANSRRGGQDSAAAGVEVIDCP